MIIEPKSRGFICTTAHPTGCHHNVLSQINYVKSKSALVKKPKHVLVIGGSTGYGLASRIVATYAGGAKTIAVSFERPATEKRTATAGWYNTAAFEKIAHADQHYAKSLNGDAFSQDMKQQTVALIRQDFGKVDCVIYSLASPRRQMPDGSIAQSVLKPVGAAYRNKTINPETGEVSEISLEPATPEEIADTVKVMGGGDWQDWIDYLQAENVLAADAITCAYSYVGPVLTHAIYKNWTIGHAKDHLLRTAHSLDDRLKKTGGRAFVSVNKAVVTQASAAIPVVPLYISILFKLMKAKGTHEGCIEQMYRLFHDLVYTGNDIPMDEAHRVRVDDLEMQPDIQQAISDIWKKVSTENVADFADLAGYRHDFFELFGFGVAGVDYQADVEI